MKFPPSLHSVIVHRWRRPLRAISFAALFALGVPAAHPAETAEDAPVITLTKTPPAVQKTVLANIGIGKVISISKSDEGAVQGYEVNFIISGQPRDLHVGEDGTLLSIQVAFAQTPPEVQKAIQAQLGTDKMGNIEKTFEAGETSYVVDTTTKDGRDSEFTIGEDGTLLETEIALGDAPSPVQTTIAAQMGDGTLTNLTKIIEDSVTYDVEFTKDGKNGEVFISPEGNLLSVVVTLAETGEAKKTILEKLGDGKLLSIKKSFEKRENVFPFKVESVKDGKYFNFSVGPKGRFLGMDD